MRFGTGNQFLSAERAVELGAKRTKGKPLIRGDARTQAISRLGAEATKRTFQRRMRKAS
ncbi:MAG: hypothetical protein RLY20_2487 [Verrucomicrobiota bacterium]|jgi:hypothetical protein